MVWARQENRLHSAVQHKPTGIVVLSSTTKRFFSYLLVCIQNTHKVSNYSKTVISVCLLGTMQRLSYGQFDESIQALIAENKFMVLTFCLDRLFSVIFTREPKVLANEVRLVKISLQIEIQDSKYFKLIFFAQDLQNIRILLKNRGLSVVAGQGECSIAANTIERMSILALLGATTIAFLFKYLW